MMSSLARSADYTAGTLTPSHCPREADWELTETETAGKVRIYWMGNSSQAAGLAAGIFTAVEAQPSHNSAPTQILRN